MRKRFFDTASAAIGMLAALSLLHPGSARAGAITGNATEWTQLLNNSELVNLSGQSAEQIKNQVTQISQLSEQIDNQLKIYRNMLQNTLKLPDHEWGQAQNDLIRLRDVVNQGRGIAFSMGNIDDVLKQRFQSFSEFKTGLAGNKSFSASYQNWSDTNRDTIAASLWAAGMTAAQFDSEEATMGKLRAMSDSAAGQMQALQIGHEIAAEQIAQVQKLRGLVSQQITMMGTWYQSEQAARDLAQNRREEFFKSTAPATSGGEMMEPRWK